MEIVNFTTTYIDNFIKFIENNNSDLLFFHPHEMNYDSIFSILSNKKNDKYKIVIYEDRVIGYGILRGWDEGFEIPSLGIMIDKDFRGIGLSKTIMKFLESTARIMGAKKIRIVVHKDNQVAYNLYKSLNYEFETYNENQLISFKKI
jgi:RimJ/RimL family protein N-acetyltransferase